MLVHNSFVDYIYICNILSLEIIVSSGEKCLSVLWYTLHYSSHGIDSVSGLDWYPHARNQYLFQDWKRLIVLLLKVISEDWTTLWGERSLSVFLLLWNLTTWCPEAAETSVATNLTHTFTKDLPICILFLNISTTKTRKGSADNLHWPGCTVTNSAESMQPPPYVRNVVFTFASLRKKIIK